MPNHPYNYSCHLRHGRQEYFASGTISKDGQATVTIYESSGSKVGEKRFHSTLTLASAITDHSVGEMVRRQLAGHLGRRENKVAVTKVRLSRPDRRSKAAREETLLYNFRCHLARDTKHYTAYGEVADGVIALTLHDFTPASNTPSGSGGGTYGKELLVDTLRLQKSMNDRQLREHVRHLVHRRVARHLRCAPRMVGVTLFGMSRDTSAANQRASEAKKRK